MAVMIVCYLLMIITVITMYAWYVNNFYASAAHISLAYCVYNLKYNWSSLYITVYIFVTECV